MDIDKNYITWGQLKEFVNSLPDSDLENKVPVSFEDETQPKFLLEPFKMENNIYAHIDDDERTGTIEELKDSCEVDNETFKESDYYVCTKKGTPFLWID